jgi:DNA modification methylase
MCPQRNLRMISLACQAQSQVAGLRLKRVWEMPTDVEAGAQDIGMYVHIHIIYIYIYTYPVHCAMWIYRTYFDILMFRKDQEGNPLYIVYWISADMWASRTKAQSPCDANTFQIRKSKRLAWVIWSDMRARTHEVEHHAKNVAGSKHQVGLQWSRSKTLKPKAKHRSHIHSQWNFLGRGSRQCLWVYVYFGISIIV